AKLVGAKGEKKKSIEDLKLPTQLEFLQDTYLSVMVVMVPLYIITAAFAGQEFGSTLSGSTNYIMFAFLQSIQFVVGIYV
ncbi:PTS transporter subunit IIC, partial [Alkalihalophilus pseudofirmus]